MGAEQAGEALGPGARAFPVRDQVLPDLDQDVGEAARGGEGVDRVAGKSPIVGLVVADVGGAEVGFGDEGLDQRPGDAVVAVPQHADLPSARRRRAISA